MSLNKIIKSALCEDIGKRDITTDLLIPSDRKIKAVIIAKEKGIICGIDIARKVFQTQDKRVKFKALAKDGQSINKGRIIATLNGPARSILTAERVALNFLGFLSGIATRTRQFVDTVEPYKVKILDTRKTLPGLRELEKYAVRVGGGYNHRMRLDEMVLIKDNHIKVTGGYRRLLAVTDGCGEKISKNIKIEVEVNNLSEFKEALKLNPDIIMLDNMALAHIRKAVIIKQATGNRQRVTKIEASGNINLGNIHTYAQTGVDFISIGSLTKDVESLDLSLEVK